MDMSQKNKWSLPVGGGYLGLLLFADKCWIPGMSKVELQTMVRAWNQLLRQAGLHVDWGEAVWCTTAQDCLTGSIKVSDETITRRAREEGSKALGVWITFDGLFTKEVAEREVRAWRRFFTLGHLFCNNDVALKYRLRLLTSCVMSSMYWCAGSSILTRTQCKHLRAVQDHMLRKVICVPRCPEEFSESHMVRWSRLLRNCRATHKFLHGDETYFAQYFSWCGHIARITTRDPGRETSKMYMNKNIAWLRDLNKELGTQCHGRRFRVWTWELAVAQCFGEKWVEKARSNTGWRAKQEEMTCWIKQKVGGSQLCRNGVTLILFMMWTHFSSFCLYHE